VTADVDVVRRGVRRAEDEGGWEGRRHRAVGVERRLVGEGPGGVEGLEGGGRRGRDKDYEDEEEEEEAGDEAQY